MLDYYKPTLCDNLSAFGGLLLVFACFSDVLSTPVAFKAFRMTEKLNKQNTFTLELVIRCIHQEMVLVPSFFRQAEPSQSVTESADVQPSQVSLSEACEYNLFIVWFLIQQDEGGMSEESSRVLTDELSLLNHCLLHWYKASFLKPNDGFF